MTTSSVRVWVEEVDPPDTLRFTWKLPDENSLDQDEARDAVRSAVEGIDGVLRIEHDGQGLLLDIDSQAVTRYDLAAAIRAALQPGDIQPPDDIQRLRVWAEDLTTTELRVTWEAHDGVAHESERQQRRRVAAWLSVTAGVKSATTDDEGVVIRYVPEKLDRVHVGDDVRAALDDDIPLRERTDDLMKRAKIYGNLGRKLALDDRISPLPGAAKQAVAARATGGGGNAVVGTAMRFIPGASLIARIQTLLPMLTELSKWSREADPEIVEHHLSSVGLDRDTLRRDTITAHEIRYYARDSASETASALGDKASEGARQAISVGRDMFASFRQAIDQSREERAARSSNVREVEAEQSTDDSTTDQRDSSPEDPRSGSE